MIVDFAHIQGYEEWREGVYARNELNIRAKPPSHFCLKVLCKKEVGGGVFWQLVAEAKTTADEARVVDETEVDKLGTNHLKGGERRR